MKYKIINNLELSNMKKKHFRINVHIVYFIFPLLKITSFEK